MVNRNAQKECIVKNEQGHTYQKQNHAHKDMVGHVD